MKKLVVLLAVCLMATSAFAQIDPDPNSLGFYFDTAATETGFAPTLFVPFDAYLVLANPTYATVSGVECTMDVLGNPAIALNSVVYPNGGLSVYLPPNIYAGWADPLPTTPITIMATFNYTAYSPAVAEVFLSASATPSIPSDGFPVLIADEELQPCAISSGDITMPVARFFGEPVVSEEVQSFGSVKSLFR
jgi:hypothetical protein